MYSFVCVCVLFYRSLFISIYLSICFIYIYIYIYIYIHVCVCVLEREREREYWILSLTFVYSHSKVNPSVATSFSLLWENIIQYLSMYLSKIVHIYLYKITLCLFFCLSHSLYIYTYIVIHRQIVSFYQNSSVGLDTQDARSRDRKASNFTLD